MIEIRQLPPGDAARYIGPLAEILVDCVDGGASVNFMAPFSPEAARNFFAGVVRSVERGERLLLAAFDGERLVGTVQLVTALPPNQPHRAEVAKLLVHRSARGQGVAEQLMTTLDQVARQLGKTLLTLDTVSGSNGERLYRRLGWTSAGVIPNYALFPDGTPCDTTIFWKEIAR